jgi:hypothetical protein
MQMICTCRQRHETGRVSAGSRWQGSGPPNHNITDTSLHEHDGDYPETIYSLSPGSVQVLGLSDAPSHSSMATGAPSRSHSSMAAVVADAPFHLVATADSVY